MASSRASARSIAFAASGRGERDARHTPASSQRTGFVVHRSPRATRARAASGEGRGPVHQRVDGVGRRFAGPFRRSSRRPLRAPDRVPRARPSRPHARRAGEPGASPPARTKRSLRGQRVAAAAARARSSRRRSFASARFAGSAPLRRAASSAEAGSATRVPAPRSALAAHPRGARWRASREGRSKRPAARAHQASRLAPEGIPRGPSGALRLTVEVLAAERRAARSWSSRHAPPGSRGGAGGRGRGSRRARTGSAPPPRRRSGARPVAREGRHDRGHPRSRDRGPASARARGGRCAGSPERRVQGPVVEPPAEVRVEDHALPKRRPLRPRSRSRRACRSRAGRRCSPGSSNSAPSASGPAPEGLRSQAPPSAKSWRNSKSLSPPSPARRRDGAAERGPTRAPMWSGASPSSPDRAEKHEGAGRGASSAAARSAATARRASSRGLPRGSRAAAP